jgi:hypothetical protein
MHALLLSTIYPWSIAPSMTRFYFCITGNLLFFCLAMLSIYCCNSGIWVWSLYESSMIVCRGNCGELVKLVNRPGWAATRIVVIWLILATLGTEFLSLDTRWAYHRTWRNGTPVDWLTCLDLSMSYLVWAFHLAYAWVCKMFAKRCIHTGTWPRLLEVDSSNEPILTHNKRFRVRERPSFDGGLRPFGIAHGIGRREVKVVGDHHMWVKLCTPAGLNLFEKPCPRLRMTWRQILDHRQHEPNHKSANLRVWLWITSLGSRGWSEMSGFWRLWFGGCSMIKRVIEALSYPLYKLWVDLALCRFHKENLLSAKSYTKRPWCLII